MFLLIFGSNEHTFMQVKSLLLLISTDLFSEVFCHFYFTAEHSFVFAVKVSCRKARPVDTRRLLCVEGVKQQLTTDAQ